MALTKHNRLTVVDLRKLKGKRQLTMLFVETPEEAAAASAAGIDILSIIEPLWSSAMREAAGDCFVRVGLIYGQHHRGLSARRTQESNNRRERVLLRRQPRYDHQARGRGHPRCGPCRAH